jgi:transposase
MIEVVLERCAGIDVGKRYVVACLLTGSSTESPRVEKRQYEATVGELERLRQWLVEERCTHVVVESTGSYWKPVFNVLEASVTVVLANPVHVRNLRGHKTDRKDSEWLAHLLRHGLIRPSFIPPPAIRELRSLTRQRRDLIAAGARERNRVQKLLEEGNVKLGNVLSDVFGSRVSAC